MLPGADQGPLNGGPGLVVEHHGFLELVFLQDAATFQTLVIRQVDDEDLALIRHDEAHQVMSQSVPGFGAWTDPERAEATGPVRVGGGLINRYRGQALGIQGLLAIGDALMVTNPNGARGVTFAMTSAGALADIVATTPEADWAPALDDWGATHLRPWFLEHCAFDTTMLARWNGHDLDPDGPIGWDLIGAAAAEHPEWAPVLGPYMGMLAPPTTIEPLREDVRVMLRAGWRPTTPAGITRDQLATVIRNSPALVDA